MTFVTTVLLGAGFLFMASALDGTPLVQTFQKIIGGQAIDWTGKTSSATTSATSATATPSTGTSPATGIGSNV